MIIPIASDHAGFQAKIEVKKILESLGYLTIDFGTHSEDSVDYPDYAVLVAKAVSSGEYEKGILICGSGQGMCMTANKYSDVRAALVWNPELASLSVQHNNANVLCLPGRYLSPDELKLIIESWLKAHFEGGRHQNRVDKISKVTKTDQE
ncbi:MAG TPA: ribose 5-phosphate isomerase B [Bacteroidetes bacterium]|nr:ribose 5-phosphate isomerase B [Bacteroidota bacterium]